MILATRISKFSHFTNIKAKDEAETCSVPVLHQSESWSTDSSESLGAGPAAGEPRLSGMVLNRQEELATQCHFDLFYFRRACYKGGFRAFFVLALCATTSKKSIFFCYKSGENIYFLAFLLPVAGFAEYCI